jgi:hypothetical protein
MPPLLLVSNDVGERGEDLGNQEETRMMKRLTQMVSCAG